MLNKRQQKKKDAQAVKFANYVMWSVDFRAYLIEADCEGVPLSIICRQFKRRLKREPNFAVPSRMASYFKFAMSRD